MIRGLASQTSRVCFPAALPLSKFNLLQQGRLWTRSQVNSQGTDLPRADSEEAPNIKPSILNALPVFRPGSPISPFLAILQAACLVASLSIQLLLLKSAQVQQQALGKANSSLVLLTLAVALGFLHHLWSNSKRDELVGGPLSASGAVRLHRLEILHTRQSTALVSLEREASRIRLRVHSISKDIQPALRQVQAESTLHADGLALVAKRIESLSRDVEDTRELLAALQGASLKQLQLVIQAINLARQSAGTEIQMPPQSP